MGGVQVQMVEHLMSALAGLGVDCCEVRVSAEEMPGLDGSSRAFVEAVDSVGVEDLGAPADRVTPPANWEELFKAGVECRDDVDGALYPPLEQLKQVFFESYRSAIAAVAAATDAQLVAANPADGRMRELFPTLGGMINFYLAGHTQSHLGQLSAWRRAMGLPAA